jgi:hypothetical protein
MTTKVRAFFSKVHQKESASMKLSDLAVEGKPSVFTWGNYILDDFDDISPEQYRTWLPLILSIVDGDEGNAEESYEVYRFIGRPWSEYLRRSGKFTNLLSELMDESNLVNGWQAPSLRAFSQDELEFSYSAVRDLVDRKGSSFAFHDDLKHLETTISMFLGTCSSKP